MQHPKELIIPDLFSLTPFPWSGPNPHFSNRESTKWMLNFGIFVNHKRTRLDAANAELLGACAYPYADAKGLRIVNDFLMILFALDEITDDQDAQGAKDTRETFVRALKGESGYDTSPITLFTKDYLRYLSSSTEEFRSRFIAHCIGYIDATANEACLRAKGEVQSIEDYTHLRRENGGMLVCYDLIELINNISLPAEVFEDPNFLRVYFAAVDMVSFANDIYSWPFEYARGLEGSNAVTVIMKSKGLSIQEAVDHVALIYKGFSDTFISCKENIRSFGPTTDEAIQLYIFGLEQWVYGNLVWSLDTQRYFGKDNEEVKRTGVVKLKEHNSVI